MRDRQAVEEELTQHLSPYFLKRISHNNQGLYKISQSTLRGLADEIFGPENWERGERDVRIEHKETKGNVLKVLVSIIVRVTLADGTFHEDVGYGAAGDEDPGVATDKACEYARQNGLARCLRQFGNALGNCLSPQFTEVIEKHLRHELQ